MPALVTMTKRTYSELCEFIVGDEGRMALTRRLFSHGLAIACAKAHPHPAHPGLLPSLHAGACLFRCPAQDRSGEKIRSPSPNRSCAAAGLVATHSARTASPALASGLGASAHARTRPRLVGVAGVLPATRPPLSLAAADASP